MNIATTLRVPVKVVNLLARELRYKLLVSPPLGRTDIIIIVAAQGFLTNV